MYDIFGQLSNQSLKTAIALSKIDYHVTKAAFKNTKVIQESRNSESYGICVIRNNFGYKITGKVITDLTQGGIMQYLFDYLINFEVWRRCLDDDVPSPTVFSIGDLEFGFIIWLVACGISFCAFIMELLWYFVKVKLPKILQQFAFLLAIFILRRMILKIH